MAQSVGAFIEYDPQGKPYIGLILNSEGTTVTFFLAHRREAKERIQAMASQLNKLASEIQGMPDQLVAANGSEISAIESLRKQ